MSFYLIRSEYDMDLAVNECIKLLNIKHSRVKVGFANMKMVNIFMENLSTMIKEKVLNPKEMDFQVDVLVEAEEENTEEESPT